MMMKKIKTKTKYEANGRTFTDATAAEFWEKLSQAKDALDQAKYDLGVLLAESFKTADGEPFKVGCRTYYHVFRPWNAMPTILEVSFWWNHWGFDSERDNDTRMMLYSFTDGWGHERTKDPVAYPIDELYYCRDAAEKALMEAKWAYSVDVAKEVSEWEKRHGR